MMTKDGRLEVNESADTDKTINELKKKVDEMRKGGKGSKTVTTTHKPREVTVTGTKIAKELWN